MEGKTRECQLHGSDLSAQVRRFCGSLEECKGHKPQNEICTSCENFLNSCHILEIPHESNQRKVQECSSLAYEICEHMQSTAANDEMLQNGVAILHTIAHILQEIHNTPSPSHSEDAKEDASVPDGNACLKGVYPHVNCEGNLNIPRSQMPQFNTIPAYKDLFVKIHHKLPKASANLDDINLKNPTIHIRPIQKEIQAKKIEEICAHSKNKNTIQPMLPPILLKGALTPSIYYVLDGHHRVFAELGCNTTPQKNMKVLIISSKEKHSSKEFAEEIINMYVPKEATRLNTI